MMLFAAQGKTLVLYSHTLREWLDRLEGDDFFLQGREANTQMTNMTS